MQAILLYIDGAFVDPASGENFAAFNPVTEAAFASVAAGDAAGVFE
ncbi:MAG: acyl-CoA reductase-like NAD-dependent aldehyde dehydrogenase [Akkermansiaceae bacterium]|jgi:acyl-CoA reductase-like NAD-dependent aldehyde dehydrogenase